MHAPTGVRVICSNAQKDLDERVREQRDANVTNTRSARNETKQSLG